MGREQSRPQAESVGKNATVGQSRLECRCRQRSGGCRGSARMARWCRTTLGDHVARRLVCVVFSFVLGPYLSMEPGREFFIDLGQRAFARLQAGLWTHKTLLHGTVECQPPCSQNTARSVSKALLTRVYHRTWTDSRWMFEKWARHEPAG